MNGRETDVDALFERDADARLLERRRREELGLPAMTQPRSPGATSFGAESLTPDEDRVLRPPTLRVALDARPDRELIPGALVTVVISVHDDGDGDVPDATVRLSAPPDAEPVASAFARDDVPIDGEALLGTGLRLGAIPAQGVVRLRLALRVLPGTEPIDLIVTANADGIPSVAPPTLRLRRRAGHAAYETPRPFYELEEGERVDHHEETPAPTLVDTRSVEAAVPEAIPIPTPPADEPILALSAPPEPALALPAPSEPELALPPPAEPAAPVLFRRVEVD
ncbi:MAG: hypothetical protein ABR975_09755, partial [Vulcanimicrobiaceae bacterium]